MLRVICATDLEAVEELLDGLLAGAKGAPKGIVDVRAHSSAELFTSICNEIQS